MTRARRSDERGFTLAELLVGMTLALIAGAGAVTFVRAQSLAMQVQAGQADILTARNYRGASHSLFAAEAGIAHTVGIINQTGVVDLQNDVYGVWTGHNAPFGANPQPMAQASGYFYSVSIAMDPYHAGDHITNNGTDTVNGGSAGTPGTHGSGVGTGSNGTDGATGNNGANGLIYNLQLV